MLSPLYKIEPGLCLCLKKNYRKGMLALTGLSLRRGEVWGWGVKKTDFTEKALKIRMECI